MKTLLIPTMALAAFLAVPQAASAKDRGCAYRLAGLEDARIAVRRASFTGKGLDVARAQLSRAEHKARGEGCYFEPVRARRVVTKTIVKEVPVAVRRDRPARAAFVHRGIFGRPHRHVVVSDRDRDRVRFDTLVRIARIRRLTQAEECERDDLRKRWRF